MNVLGVDDGKGLSSYLTLKNALYALLGAGVAAGVWKLVASFLKDKKGDDMSAADGSDGNFVIPVTLYGDPEVHYVAPSDFSPLTGAARLSYIRPWARVTRVGPIQPRTAIVRARPVPVVAPSTPVPPPTPILVNTTTLPPGNLPQSAFTPFAYPTTDLVPYAPPWSMGGGGGGGGGDQPPFYGDDYASEEYMDDSFSVDDELPEDELEGEDSNAVVPTGSFLNPWEKRMAAKLKKALAARNKLQAAQRLALNKAASSLPLNRSDIAALKQVITPSAQDPRSSPPSQMAAPTVQQMPQWTPPGQNSFPQEFGEESGIEWEEED
jgi:hypothetical protein